MTGWGEKKKGKKYFLESNFFGWVKISKEGGGGGGGGASKVLTDCKENRSSVMAFIYKYLYFGRTYPFHGLLSTPSLLPSLSLPPHPALMPVSKYSLKFYWFFVLAAR